VDVTTLAKIRVLRNDQKALITCVVPNLPVVSAA